MWFEPFRRNRLKTGWWWAIGWVGGHLAWYLPFGHTMVVAMYDRRAPEFLNKVIQERERFPVEHFIDQADSIFYGQVLFFPLCMFLFYAFLFMAFKRLVANSDLTRLPRFDDEGGWSKKYGWLMATGLYLVVTLIYFRDVWTGFDTHVIGPAEDNLKYLWSMWYGWQAVTTPELSFTFTTKMFYPEGVSLWYNDWSFYNLLLSFGLRQLLTPAGVYNVLIMHSFPLAGLGTFFLVRHLTNHTPAALAAGLIFAFSPSHLAHAQHHMNITSIHFLPFFLLFFIKTMTSSSKRNLVLASLFFLLLAGCDWTWMIFAGIMMLYFYAMSALKKGQLVDLALLKKMAVIVGSTLLVLSPWIWGMIVEGLRYSIGTGGGHRSFVIDMVALILPHYLHPLASLDIVAELNNLYTGNLWEATAYLGVVNIILLIYGVRKLADRTAIWRGAFLFFGVLSMGTCMHFAGWSMPLFLPFSVVKYMPILKHVRVPARFITLVYLFTAIIVGFSLADLAKRCSSLAKGRLLISLVALLIVIDFYPREVATSEVSLPAGYLAIIADDQAGEGGILDLPSGRIPSERYLMYQTMHGRSIMQGFVPRRPGRPMLDSLNMEDLDYQKDQLQRVAVRYIVWHKTIDGALTIEMDRYRVQYTVIHDDSLNLVLAVY